MLKETYPYYLANEPIYANEDLVVYDKYTGEPATRVAMAGHEVIDAGIGAAVEAQQACADMPAYERQAVLEHCVSRFRNGSLSLRKRFVLRRANPSMIPKVKLPGSLTLSRLRRRSRLEFMVR